MVGKDSQQQPRAYCRDTRQTHRLNVRGVHPRHLTASLDEGRNDRAGRFRPAPAVGPEALAGLPLPFLAEGKKW